MSTGSPSRSSAGRGAKQHPGTAVVVAVSPPLSLAARENSCASALFLPDYGSLILNAVISAQQDAYGMAQFEGFCAEKIQSVFRMYRARRTYRHLRRAVLSIQRVFRAYVVRKEVKVHLQEEEVEYARSCFHYYATRIQAIFRGYYSRKYVDDYYARRAYIFAVAERSDSVLQNAIRQRIISDAESYQAQQEKEAAAYTKATEQVHFILSTVGCSGVYRRWPLGGTNGDGQDREGQQGDAQKNGSAAGSHTGKLQALPFHTNIEDDIRKNAQRVRREAELARVAARTRKAAVSHGEKKGLEEDKNRAEEGKVEGNTKMVHKERKRASTQKSTTSSVFEKEMDNVSRKRISSKAVTMAGRPLGHHDSEIRGDGDEDNNLLTPHFSDDAAEDAFEKVYASGNLCFIMDHSLNTEEKVDRPSEEKDASHLDGCSKRQRKARGSKSAVDSKRNRFGRGCGKAPMQSAPSSGLGSRQGYEARKGNREGGAGVGNAVEGFRPGEWLGPHQYPTPSTVSNCAWENPDALPLQRPMIPPQDCCMKSGLDDKRLCQPSPLPPPPPFSCFHSSAFPRHVKRGKTDVEAAKHPILFGGTPSSFSRGHRGVAHNCLLPPLVESTYNTDPVALKKSVDRLYQQHLHHDNVFKVSHSMGVVPRTLPPPPLAKIAFSSSS